MISLFYYLLYFLYRILKITTPRGNIASNTAGETIPASTIGVLFNFIKSNPKTNARSSIRTITARPEVYIKILEKLRFVRCSLAGPEM